MTQPKHERVLRLMERYKIFIKDHFMPQNTQYTEKSVYYKCTIHTDQMMTLQNSGTSLFSQSTKP